MEVTVLIDNNPDPQLSLCHEHGLSFYFEIDGFKWLFDVGASDQFYVNARKLDIAIEDVDYLILSHGHKDHTGGLQQFLTVNSKAKVILSSLIRGNSFYSSRRGSKRNISTDWVLIEKYISRFIFVDQNFYISEHVGLVCEFSDQYTKPKANKTLYISGSDQDKLDDFKHEIALSLNTPVGVVVFSGCSHNGVLNILKACSDYLRNTHIIACIGGTHLIDSETSKILESKDEIRQIGKTIRQCYPDMVLITGHCTGVFATQQLANELGSRIQIFYSGARFELL